MERRTLGRTGDELSIVGVGGVAVVGMTQSEADALVGEAIDRGINYFDVAPSYGRDQETEKRFGEALSITGRRDKVFLACKTGVRTKEGAAEELRRSLTNLQTDRFDLYQLHAITSREDVETAFGPGGAMETILEAQQAGMIRHIGFSAHSTEAALLAMEKSDFASALFPINFVTYFEGEFGGEIIDKAIEKGVGRLALKAMARTKWGQDEARPYPHCWYEPIDDPRIAELALRWTLTQSVTAAVPPGDPRLCRMAWEFAARFRPLTTEELPELRDYAHGLFPIFPIAA